MSRIIGIGLAVLLAAGASAQAETLKVAIPQKGAWDTSFTSYGIRQGFFEDEGLDVELTYTEGGATTEQAVVSGSVDMAMATGTLGIISAYVKGAPVRIISSEATGTPDLYWYARVESGIKSLRDVAGKTIAFSAPGSSSNLVLLTLLKEAGVTAKPTPTGAMPGTFTQVMSGQIDAGWAAPPFGIKDIREGRIVVIARGNDSPDVRTETFRVNVVNLNVLQQRRDAIVRFAKAYYRSWQWAYADPKALDYLAEDNHISRDIADYSVKNFLPKEASDPYRLSGLQRVLDEAYNAKRIPDPMKENQIKGLIDIVWQPAK